NHSLHPKQPAPRSQNRHRRLLPLQRPSPNPKTLRPSQIHFHHFHPQITLNPVLLFNSIPYPSQKHPVIPTAGATPLVAPEWRDPSSPIQLLLNLLPYLFPYLFRSLYLSLFSAPSA